ncbi:hypothetical protein BDQ12DRAFT_683522 [Crucibulum laeve]|uniref:Uncharacterized protein n=1 Tax=Crucibulum laeve TaxID=68775 RepID=A0A5C3M2J8_9AGAR|nr:hypothetical protein BDQ12DRAFT_683522 [Crucibulum laeve]
MVHRPADSRLLTNLLSHEKDYSKHLLSLLDYSHASLASFSAYASASSPPASQVILQVASSLAGADDALRRYAASIDEWREMMKGLKTLEDEVGNIMRDREILVTRLIKASKSQKPNRDSLILSNQRFPSSSSLSLSPAPDSPSPAGYNSPQANTYSAPGLPTSSKLVAAQSELQACEAHLASKEHELAARRNAAVREGLSIRCRAMVECGWTWGERGKEALSALQSLSEDNTNRLSYISPQQASVQTISSKANIFPHDSKPLPEPAPASDISSIGPSQSASQVNLVPPSVPPPIQNGYYPFETGPAGPSSGTSSNSHQQQFSVRPASYLNTEPQTMHIPPAHAISDLALPTSTTAPPQRHVLSRRITEEELQRTSGHLTEENADETRSWIQNLDINGRSIEDASTSEDEQDELQEGKLAVVENPRFATEEAPKKTSLLNPQHDRPPPIQHLPHVPVKEVKEKTTGLFGSLRVFFGGKSHREKEHQRETHQREDSDEEEPRTLGTIFAKKKQHDSPKKGSSPGKWDTRTTKNLKNLQRKESDEDLPASVAPTPSVRKPAFSPVIMPEDGVGTGGPSRFRGRGRVVSDAAAVFVRDNPGGSDRGAGAKGSRLRKPRATRSASVPPPAGNEAARPVTHPTPSATSTSTVTTSARPDQTKPEHAHVQSQNPSNAKGKGRAVDKHMKGWSSDTAAMTATPAVSSGIQRKKSLTKGKPLTSVTQSPPAASQATVMQAGSNAGGTMPAGASLSRNTSLMSASSAPTGKSHLANGTTGTVTDLGKSNTTTGLGQGMPTTTVGRRSTITGAGRPNGSGTGHRRAMSVDHGKTTSTGKSSVTTSHAHTQSANANSLMSIVEGASRVRLQGTEMETVRAPPRVGRDDILNADKKAATFVPQQGGMELPKAPGPVVDMLRASGSDMDINRHVRSRSISGNVKDASASAPDLHSQGHGFGRPAKSPLKSALRNSSRTPSPMMGPLPVENGSINSIPPITGPSKPRQLEAPRSQSVPAPMASIPRAPGSVLTSMPTPAPAPSRPAVSTPPTSSTQAQRVPSPDVQEEYLDDDAASISSYETGHEVFDWGDEAPEEAQATSNVTRPVPMRTGSESSTASESATPRPPPKPQPDFTQYGSDASVSTVGPSSSSLQPQRRKSVRVSLQPTFSPTPPAIDDDDEEEQMKHAPWAWKNNSNAPVSDHSRQSDPKSNEAVVRDVWEDSSEEDVEYQKARRLLSKVAKKAKARK